MIFNVSGLIQDGFGAKRTYDVEGEVPVVGGSPEKVIGTAEIIRTKDGVLVRGHMRLVEPEDCSRCLKPLVETVQIEFEEEFLATTDVKSGRPLDQALDPDAFRIDENHMLDLTEAVRQYREVSTEMQPLCRPDCPGLCPLCGADLNEGDHDCEAGPVDSRWAGLASLRLESSEGKD
jgi:uncharacterized protein